MRTIVVLVAVGAMVMSGCGSRTCSRDTCGGCCDSFGWCQVGDSPLACGAGGYSCVNCGAGEVCAQQMCGPAPDSGAPHQDGGTGEGGRLTLLSMTAAEDVRYIMAGQAWDFDLVSPPTTATAIYIEVSACLGAGNGPGATVQFSTAASGYYVDISPTSSCASTIEVRSVDAKQVWMGSASPHRLHAAVPSVLGSAGNPTARVRVLGWYEP